jgi:hypothetical protein
MSDASSDLDPIDGYPLGEYRKAAAKYIKLMIRARAKTEPDFLSEEQYGRWNLCEIAADVYTVENLLRMADAAHEHLWGVFIGPHGSGGVAEDDPRAELKQSVVRFTTGTPPADLLNQLHEAGEIDWANVAEWALLDSIREGLDGLPMAKATAAAESSGCPVVILDQRQRRVKVLGQTKQLTAARFAVIKALIEQFPGTHTKDELVRTSQRDGAVNILKGLRNSDPVWESIIKLAGTTGGGYGLVAPSGD